MDLVYLTKREILNDNIELRYSLRSAEKNLKFDNVFLIGYKPDFIKNVNFIKYNDIKNNKYNNVYEKMKIILETKEISDNFILSNDDFFILKEYNEIPYYYKGTLEYYYMNYQYKESYYYKEGIKKLYEEFKNGLFFGVHFPIVYNKEKLKFIIDKYKSNTMLRSYYCNYFIKEINPVFTDDFKILDVKEIEKYNNCPFISTTNLVASTTEFKSFINNKFCNPSKYEL
ncbi:MAG TPA: hypothetical protein PKV21_06445 [bacterium]|nr:hypothetical protein [bacterium]